MANNDREGSPPSRGTGGGNPNRPLQKPVRKRTRPVGYNGVRGSNPLKPIRSNVAAPAVVDADADQANKVGQTPEPGKLERPQSVAVSPQRPRADYEVGYKKPPLWSRFKSGQSGNAKGRSKGSQNLQAIFEREGRKLVEIIENGRSRKIPKRELTLKNLINNAVKGDHKAIMICLKLEEKFEVVAASQTASAESEDDAANSGYIMRWMARAVIEGHPDLDDPDDASDKGKQSDSTRKQKK